MQQNLLKPLFDGKDLSEKEAEELMTDIFSGQTTNAQIGAMMAALAVKGETVLELVGAARAMRKKALRFQITAKTIVDTCGTGGDHSKTFNISTTAAFVVAACGVTVAKHGNRSITSKCGSADLLEYLGVDLNVDPEVVEEAISEIGIGFLFAPLYHNAMKYAAPARKEIGLRSIFNMLGPLTNPAHANCQVLGVYAPHLTEMFADALDRLGVKRAFVVHGHDGLDEISVCASTRVSELNDGLTRTYDFSPEPYFGKLAEPESLLGGSPEENAAITKRILAGEKGPQRNIVVINAAAALLAADTAPNLEAAVHMAESAIDSGKAADKLNALVEFTQMTG